MFTHYLKIAFRNLRKYKMQTIISIIGLAVGFVCFALSALWLRYERSFDTFHSNAEHIFIVTNHDAVGSSDRFSRTLVPDWLLTYLPEKFPEIQRTAAASIPWGRGTRITVNNVEVPVNMLTVDESFFEMFGVRILQGSIQFYMPDTRYAAITVPKARQLFGNESPIGKTFTRFDREYTIVAVVSSWAGPSNIPYDILMIRAPFPPREDNMPVNFVTQVFFQIYPTVNPDIFLERLENHTTERDRLRITRLSALPLTSLRASYEFNPTQTIRHQYIVWFSLIGLLVIACALFNYFTLFFSRFRIRQKEFALRLVCGASTKSLFAMLAAEFLMLLLIASALGLVLTRLFQSFFENLSSVDLPLSTVLMEAFLYFLVVMAIALMVFFLLLLIFKKRNLNVAIRRRKSANARRLSVMFQLIVSIVLIFCTVVVIKQLNHLHRADNLGIDFTNTAIVSIREDQSAVEAQLQQIPEIEQVFNANYAIFPRRGSPLPSRFITEWDNQVPGSEETLSLEEFRLPPELIEFYGLQLVAGEFLSEGDDVSTVMINESAARAFGWYDAVGNTFTLRLQGSEHSFSFSFYIKGVLRNIQTATTVPVAPAMFQMSDGFIGAISVVGGRIVTRMLIRYREGTRDAVVNRINELFDEDVFLAGERFVFAEDEFATLLQSENALLRLLGFVSLICILISIFGFFSLVSLTCEERRKEIAIRKINGATIHDIVGIFFKEYAVLLAIGALISFPIGYYIMQRWLEQYVLQTPIPSWIYVAILLALTLGIVLCVGWRVWKASIENPADVVKSE